MGIVALLMCFALSIPSPIVVFLSLYLVLLGHQLKKHWRGNEFRHDFFCVFQLDERLGQLFILIGAHSGGGALAISIHYATWVGGRMGANSWILSLKLKKKVSCISCLKFTLVSVRWAMFIYCSLVWLGVQVIFMQGLCCTWEGESIACEASFPLELGIQLESHLWKTPELLQPKHWPSSLCCFLSWKYFHQCCSVLWCFWFQSNFKRGYQ